MGSKQANITGGGVSLPLNQANWQEFELSKIFPVIQRGKRLKTADHVKGNKPYISSTAANNGVDNFIANSNGVREFKGCITVANSGSVGQAFYHPYKFVASDHVTALINDALSSYAYMFLLPIISRLSEKYNFNHEINDVRIRKEKLLLPATTDGNPDWSYMEKYVREQANKLLSEYRKHALEAIESINVNAASRERESNCRWNEFNLSEVFSIRATASSIDKIKLKQGKGNIPYITRTDANNGVGGWVVEQPDYMTDAGNCITVGLDTQTAFYQSTPFYTGQNIQILTSKHLNAINALFLVPLIKNAMEMFSWGGNGATLTRLRRSKIMLPTTESDNPDWDFMEQYGQAVIASKTLEYLNYIDYIVFSRQQN